MTSSGSCREGWEAGRKGEGGGGGGGGFIDCL